MAPAPLQNHRMSGCWLHGLLVLAAVTSATPAMAGTRCGPSSCSDGQVCCNASCGICTSPEQACIQRHCGWGPRTVGQHEPVLPMSMVSPFAVTAVRLAARHERTEISNATWSGASTLVAGQVALPLGHAVWFEGAVERAWPDLADPGPGTNTVMVNGHRGASVGLSANLPVGSPRVHFAVQVGAGVAQRRLERTDDNGNGNAEWAGRPPGRLLVGATAAAGFNAIGVSADLRLKMPVGGGAGLLALGGTSWVTGVSASAKWGPLLGRGSARILWHQSRGFAEPEHVRVSGGLYTDVLPVLVGVEAGGAPFEDEVSWDVGLRLRFVAGDAR